jgi:hypothetical protein
MTVSSSDAAILKAYAESYVATAAAHAPSATFADIAAAVYAASQAADTKRQTAMSNASEAQAKAAGIVSTQPGAPLTPFPPESSLSETTKPATVSVPKGPACEPEKT